MDDANAVDVAGVLASTLDLIDLSSSDIRRSASLLKQVFDSPAFFRYFQFDFWYMKPRKPRFFESRGTLTDESNPLASACLDSDFFYVINHGVTRDLMEEVFVQSRRFFGLPLSEKMKLVRNEKHRSYTPLFDQVLDPANQINEILGEPFVTLCLLHYEGLVSDPSKGIYGAGAHSDFGFSTLLATDDVPGLQICKNKDAKPPTWKYVQPMRGTEDPHSNPEK